MNANLPPSMDVAENNTNGTSIGGLLKASRNRRGEDLRQVSEALRIRQVYLEAIENNNFEELPGAIYAIGFIRTYAEYLGLDGEEVVRRFKSEATSTEKKQDLTFPSLVPEHGIPGGAIVMLGLVLAAVGYGSWYYISTRNVFVTEQVPAVPENLASVIGEKPVATEPLKVDQEATNVANAAPVNNNAENKTKAALEPVTEQTTENSTDRTPRATQADNMTTETVKEVDQAAEKIEEKAAEISDEAVKTIKTTQTVETPNLNTEAPSTPNLNSTSPAESAATETIPVNEVVKPVEKPIAVAQSTQPSSDPQPTPKSEPATTPEVIEPTAPVQTAKSEEKTQPVQEVAALPEKKSEPVNAPASAATSSATENSRIVLRAVTDSYIQVRDNDTDQLLITRLLKQGDSYSVPNRSGLSLITGNAGALEILVDGTAVPSIGPIGAVRRNVVLEAEKLIDGSAVIE